MIDVAFTPAAARPAPVAVMIDVLRASSTISQALATGYERVLCCRTITEAEALRGAGRVLAGERSCVPPAGFDLGNSPAVFETLRGREVILTTTNGCPALLAARAVADEVLVGSLLNLAALLEALESREDVIAICAGTDGAPALEDTYLAGRIVAALGGERTDAARMAEAVALAYGSPGEALAASEDAGALREAGLAADVERCARESTIDVVPRVSGLIGTAAVVE